MTPPVAIVADNVNDLEGLERRLSARRAEGGAAERAAFLLEGIRVIDALIVKSDCSLDRNQEFADAGQWKGKARAALQGGDAASEAVTDFPFYELRFIMRVLGNEGRAPKEDWKTAYGMARALFLSKHPALTSNATEKSDGWLPIASAPKDEHILIAATPDWVFEARQDLNTIDGEQVWQWVTPDGKPLHKNLVPFAWQPKAVFPAHLNTGGAHG